MPEFYRLRCASVAVRSRADGPAGVEEYSNFGPRRCVPIYNALDPTTHHPVPPGPRLSGALGFLGNRLPDREARVREFLLKPATLLPDERFLLGGAGWDPNIALGPTVSHVGHDYTRDHNAFNFSTLAVLPELTPGQARHIGERALQRLLGEHTYEHRAREAKRLLVEQLFHRAAPLRRDEEVRHATL